MPDDQDGPPAGDDEAPDDDRRRPWGLYAVAALLVVVVVVALAWRAVGNGSQTAASTPARPTASDRSSPTPTPSESPSLTDHGAPVIGTSPTVSRERHGAMLPDVPKGWRLVALTRRDSNMPSTLVWIEPATGNITTAAAPPLRTSGPMVLVAGDGKVMIHPLDVVPGYLYRRTGTATQLTGGPLAGGAGPCPAPSQVRSGPVTGTARR